MCLQNLRFHHLIVLDSGYEALQGEKHINVDTIRFNRPFFITKFQHDIGILTILSLVAVTMKSALVSLTLLAFLVTSLPTDCGGTTATAATCKSLYLITIDDQNAVAALPIAADGKISAGTLTMTGGAGSVAVNATGRA